MTPNPAPDHDPGDGPSGEPPGEIPTPTLGQLYRMFPDAAQTPDIQPRKRHLVAVPDLADLESGDLEDLDRNNADPLILTALQWRATVLFWWRPALYTIAFFIVAVCAFTAAGPVVGVAWCLYGAGWIAHSIWNAHGRPSLTQIYHAHQ